MKATLQLTNRRSRGGRLAWAGWSLGLVWMAAGAALGQSGQSGPPQVTAEDDQWVVDRLLGERFLARADLRTVSYSNYFHVSDDEGVEDVRENRLKLRASYKTSDTGGLKVYGEFKYSDYDLDRLDSSTQERVGARFDGHRQEFDVWVSLEQNGRELELSDARRDSDIFNWAGEYHYRLTDEWELIGEARLWRQDFDDGTDNIDGEILGAAVRYRGFGRLFSPEVGLERRSVDAPAGGDYDEELSYVKLRFNPLRTFSMSVRYRMRDRDYLTVDPTAGNFGRRDDRGKWTLWANLLVRRNVLINVSYEEIDASSTRAGKGFDSRDVGFGVTLRAGGRAPAAKGG